MELKSGGCSEAPKPGWLGAITRACSARRSSTGAVALMPMRGCRNRSGRPLPRSINSMRTPLITRAAVARAAALRSAAIDFCLNPIGRLPPHLVGIGCEIPAPREFARKRSNALMPVKAGSTVSDTANTKTEFRQGIVYAPHHAHALQPTLYLPPPPPPLPPPPHTHPHHRPPPPPHTPP